MAQYRGRFAPSPSGLLHFGSLVTALASYLDAKHNQGTWLVRIEDIDPPRELKGASSQILTTLEAFGLHWDEEVLYQSNQSQHYLNVLNQLNKKHLTYYCQCTRADIKSMGGTYNSKCSNLYLHQKNNAIRLKNTIGINNYIDSIQHHIICDNAFSSEDFILMRKDGLFAYQLAVVVDDIYQGITHVVRGCDLIEPTVRQISLFTALKAKSPLYSHIPLAVTEQGYKLSKQNNAPAINNNNPQPTLIAALNYLGQKPPQTLISSSVEHIIEWAIKNWSLNKIAKKRQITIN